MIKFFIWCPKCEFVYGSSMNSTYDTQYLTLAVWTHFPTQYGFNLDKSTQHDGVYYTEWENYRHVCEHDKK